MRTIKLYEEFFKGDLEINLGLELEKVAREGRELTFQQFLDSFGIKFGDVDGKEMGKALMDQMKYRKMSDDEFNNLYDEYKGVKTTNESHLYDEDINENDLISLKKINSIINKQEVIDWFNQNNIEYYGMTDIEMYIKYIKEVLLNENNTNESFMEALHIFAIGFFVWKFLISILKNYFSKQMDKKTNEIIHLSILNLINSLKKMDKVPVIELGDRYFIRINDNNGRSADIRISKENKVITFNLGEKDYNIKLSDDEYNEFISLLSKK